MMIGAVEKVLIGTPPKSTMIMLDSHQIDVSQRAKNQRKLKEVEATKATNVSMHYASPHGQAL